MRAFAVALLLGLGVIIMQATPAEAATSITEPSGSTVNVGKDDQGYAAAFTVTARGFQPYENVFIEQCNGRPPTAASWSPSLDCDLGSAPAAAVADADGVATFSATDPNHALYPVVGPSPEALFNCLTPTMRSPANGVDDFTNCQVRISTSNTEGTDDQVFLRIKLPDGARVGARKPVFPSAPAAAGNATAAPNSGAATADRARDGATSTANASSSHAPESSSSDFPVLPVALGIAIVGIGGAFLILHQRRSRRVAA